MPKITVIIPTFNRAAFVVRAVDSVLNQGFKDFEIIVIDDGSTDGTRGVLKCYSNQIKYVYQKNAGVSAARNAGIALATGDWIGFLDSDDEWAPDFLARQMHAITQNNDVCMQMADCRYCDQSGEELSYFEWNGTLRDFNGAAYLRPNEPFVFVVRRRSWQIGQAVIRRDIIEKAGLFDLNFSIGEDLDFIARVALQGPLGILKDKLMTAYRRVEATENLSRIATTNPIASRRLHDGVYRKLESHPALSRNDLRAAKWIRSANYRAIGNLLLAEGKTREARVAYWTAVKIQPSPASFGRFILSFLRKGQSLSPSAIVNERDFDQV